MKNNKKNNIWISISVIIICILLLYWLFARTLIVEDENFENSDVPAVIQQPSGE